MKNEICKICLSKVSKKQRYSDYHNSCLLKLFNTSIIGPSLEFDKKIFNEEAKKHSKGMSISGVQKKLSLKIENHKLSLANIGGTYILKPTVEDFPELAPNEHLSMVIGNQLDIETPPLGLIKFSDGELVYLIKRFDWIESKKIQQEDMTQIFQLNRDTNERYKYGYSYEEVGVKLKEITGGKMAVVLDFFNRLVYNYLIQNGDYHLKNISVVAKKLSPNGFYDLLSPNYDSVMTRLYFKDESDFALDFLQGDFGPNHFSTAGFYNRSDFYDLGTKIGLTKPAADIIFDKITKKKNEIFKLIEASFLSDLKKNEYNENLKNRLKKLNIV